MALSNEFNLLRFSPRSRTGAIGRLLTFIAVLAIFTSPLLDISHTHAELSASECVICQLSSQVPSLESGAQPASLAVSHTTFEEIYSPVLQTTVLDHSPRGPPELS